MDTEVDDGGFGPIGEDGLRALLEQRHVAIAHTLQSNQLLDHKLLAVNGAALLLFGSGANLLSGDAALACWPRILVGIALFVAVVTLIHTAVAWRPRDCSLLGQAPLGPRKSDEFASGLVAFYELYTDVSLPTLHGTLIGDALRTFADMVAINEHKARALNIAIALLIVQVLALSGAVLAMR